MERKELTREGLSGKEGEPFCAALLQTGFPKGDLEDAKAKVSGVAVLDLAAGETLIKEGDQATEVFLVASGLVGVYRRLGDGKEKNIAMIGPGALQGEIGVLTGLPRFATVKAEVPTRCFAVSSEEFRHLLGVSPKFRDQVDRLFEKRMVELAQAGG